MDLRMCGILANLFFALCLSAKMTSSITFYKVYVSVYILYYIVLLLPLPASINAACAFLILQLRCGGGGGGLGNLWILRRKVSSSRPSAAPAPAPV